MWGKLAVAMRDEAARPNTAPRAKGIGARTKPTSQRTWRHRAGATLALTALVGAAGVALIAFGGRRDPAPYAAMHGTPASYATTRGQRAAIQLQDGTRVLLNVDSRLTLAPGFGDGARIVELDGEAQFIVTHDPKRPFVVRANGVLVRDLATTFNVRAYARNGATRVSVRQGLVSVQSPATTQAGSVTVRANHGVEIADDGTLVVHAIANPDAEFGWTRGRLVLDRAPLGQALVQLSRWYDVEFRVTDSAMLGLRVNLTVPEHLSEQTIRDIADVVGARVERTGGVITFVPRR